MNQLNVLPTVHLRRALCAPFLFLVAASSVVAAPAILKPDLVARHVAFFNRMEDEPVVNLVPNAEATPWLQANIPLFESPDAAFDETYYFRWWGLRKHLRKHPTGSFVFTEFINRASPVSSALGHHLMEGRWLHDSQYQDDYVRYWLRGNQGQPVAALRNFSQWLQYALEQRAHVTGDTAFVDSLLGELITEYQWWEKEKQRPDGLFWQFDVKDAMEESISGSRTKKNVRPPLNSYMYGNAQAIATIARRVGRNDVAEEYTAKAAKLRQITMAALWHPEAKFFQVRREENDALANVREEIGYIPWYFHLPEPNRGFEDAWAQLMDPAGFRAPFGITTAERRHPEFRSHGIGTCEWDGAVWPFATSQTLTALGNVLRDYPQSAVSTQDYFDALVTYARSHQYDGLPYLGEYQDEVNGQWLKGRDQRSRWYNHSTFADLVITGLAGLRPRGDDTLEVHPLLPANTWPWFCLDNVKYRGRILTIIWDRDGKRYGRGAGLTVLADGREIARAPGLARVTAPLPR